MIVRAALPRLLLLRPGSPAKRARRRSSRDPKQNDASRSGRIVLTFLDAVIKSAQPRRAKP
jgi:hypothetical protein